MARLTFLAVLIAGFTLSGFTVPLLSPREASSASLKAILIVGPQQDGTPAAMASMDEIAELFKSKGVEVFCFYDRNADWDKIKAASKGANFFVYSGHGSTMGESGKSGGLCLNSMITSRQLMEGIQLHANALVMFQSVCRGAGSSASDDGDIGATEALKRVSDYAQPFFKIGAACYYANNFEDGCLSFLSDFFSGATAKSCFEESAKTWAKIELTQKCNFDPGKVISIASTEWDKPSTRISYINGVKKVEQVPPSKDYIIGFVADPNFTINELRK